MYEFIKTQTGWRIYWGPAPTEALSTISNTEERHATLVAVVPCQDQVSPVRNTRFAELAPAVPC